MGSRNRCKTNELNSSPDKGKTSRLPNFLRRTNNKRSDNDSSTSASSIDASPNNKLNPTGSSQGRQSKRAVLCGVTYKKRRYKLKGTLNDVNNMRTFLIDCFKFPENSILVLTEEEKGTDRIPTKENIEKALKWLVEDCKEGDSLVFYFSGHGLRQPDFNGDELDGFDETLCPVDFKTKGMILDNDINSTIVRPLKRGVTLHAIIDACHSGTILDLPDVYHKEKEKWIDNRPPSGVEKGTSGGLAISFSACEDDQMAADTSAFSGKIMSGAMTSSFIQAVKKKPGLTYGELLSSIHEAIEQANQAGCLNARILSRVFQPKLLQEPQLSSSERFDIYSKKFNL